MSKLEYQKTESLAVVTLNSPPANALSTEIMKELGELLDELEKDTSVKAVLLKGEGRFFSAGADIKEFTSLQNASDYTSLARQGQKLFDRIEKFHIPFIAAVHGAALGGGLELAMACHIRLVSAEARLGLPELTLGIIPGFAGTQRLAHFVGTAKAYEMILSGKPITGEEAKAYGLVNHSLKEEDLFSQAMQLASSIAEKSGPTIHRVMELIPMAKNPAFEAAVEKEAELFGQIFGNQDAKEGIQAFIEKRKPEFKDK